MASSSSSSSSAKRAAPDSSSAFFQRDAKDGIGALESLYGKKSVALVITSPPYFGCRSYNPALAADGTNALSANHTSTHDSGAELGHESTPFAFARRLADVFGTTHEYLRDDGSVWIVLGDTFARSTFHDDAHQHASIYKGEAMATHHLFVAEMRARGWRLWQEIVWMKPAAPPSGAAQGRCNPCHEYVLVFCKREHKPRFYPREIREPGKTPAGTVMPPVGGKKYGEYTKTLVSDGMRCRQDVWVVAPSRSRRAHVAPFPEELPRLAMLATTVADDLVCDPFGGTLTTQRVAEALGRRSVCFDLYTHDV